MIQVDLLFKLAVGLVIAMFLVVNLISDLFSSLKSIFALY